jgi:Cu/Ag efflux pump CusA
MINRITELWPTTGSLSFSFVLLRSRAGVAAKRLRPKFMTMATTFIGLIPIMWATGTGSDVMKRFAAPLIGGIFASFLIELLVYPAIYAAWKWNVEVKKTADT